MPAVVVADPEGLGSTRVDQREGFAAVGQVAGELSGNKDPFEVVALGERLEVLDDHHALTGLQARRAAAGEVKADAARDTRPGQVERRG